jgi:MoaA/NifB/PqqE/SkfB family radical SAM enzyme
MILEKLPGPWRITFETNPDDCNLSCIMCERNYRKSYQKRRMPPELVEMVVDQGFKLGQLKEIIPSTLGEPLLYNHFDIFADLCSKYNIKLNLTTNGTFPKRSIDDWSRMLLPICSDIKISWNGFTNETDESIIRGRDFEKSVAKLKRLLKIRSELKDKQIDCSTITLQLTFMEMNYLEIPEIINFALDLGIERIKGHHLWVHDPEAENWSMRRNKDSINRWNQMIKSSRKLIENSKIKIENIYPISLNPDDLLIEKSVCPFLGRESWVSITGEYNPCCAPNELRKELGYFGNFDSHFLEEIWNSADYNNLCKNYNDYSLCKSCNMRRLPKDVYKYEYKRN